MTFGKRCSQVYISSVVNNRLTTTVGIYLYSADGHARLQCLYISVFLKYCTQ